MSKTILSFLLSELVTIRVKCKKCKSEATVECPIEKIGRAFENGRCKFCGEELAAPKDKPATSYLATFSQALQELAKDRNFEISLVVEDCEP